MNFSVEDILKELNDEQKLAVQNMYGPMFLISGPGSGKTRVVVERTKYMIAMGIAPESMLLFTFTNKAAKEIKKRISEAVGDVLASKITVGTYHSFCCRLLRGHAPLLGYTNSFSIFDADDSKKVATRVLAGANIKPKDLLSYIDSQKRKLISPQYALAEAMENKDSLALYYEKYQSELFRQNAMDFNCLIYNAIKLLQSNSEVLAQVNEKYKYITTDEFQDSSTSDITFIRLLVGKNNNICFVGDEDQSIYSFRGADITAVMNVGELFPNLKQFNLSRNYRSSNTIVSAAKSLIVRNSDRFNKDMFTENEDGDEIIVLEEKNQREEALRIANVIKILTGPNHNYKHSEIAILYRASAASRAIEEVFLKSSIPYQIVSGVNFYQRKEIKDIIAYLKFIDNPYDVESFVRAVGAPKRGVGESTIQKIIDNAKKDIQSIDMYTSSMELLESKLIKGTAKKGLTNFCSTCMTVAVLRDDLSVADLIREVIKFTDYYSYLENEYEENSGDRIGNVMELIELAYLSTDLTEFLSTTSLASNMDMDKSDSGHVQMMTLHMSKGLEYPVVFIVSCNDGTLPFHRSLNSEMAISEERRLMYVGMTRAEKRLFITRPKTVQQNGQTTTPNLSRFVNEIDKKYIFKND